MVWVLVKALDNTIQNHFVSHLIDTHLVSFVNNQEATIMDQIYNEKYLPLIKRQLS